MNEYTSKNYDPQATGALMGAGDHRAQLRDELTTAAPREQSLEELALECYRAAHDANVLLIATGQAIESLQNGGAPEEVWFRSDEAHDEVDVPGTRERLFRTLSEQKEIAGNLINLRGLLNRYTSRVGRL